MLIAFGPVLAPPRFLQRGERAWLAEPTRQSAPSPQASPPPWPLPLYVCRAVEAPPRLAWWRGLLRAFA
jgi:hypothetical protein